MILENIIFSALIICFWELGKVLYKIIVTQNKPFTQDLNTSTSKE